MCCSGCWPTTRRLQPRDILVMCPDIETYAPLVVAGFGLGELVGESHPAHRLRVRLADRSLVQTNPLLAVVAQLLEIADRRVTASEVLNIAETAPVRARFGFTDDDLEVITTWVRSSGIRWGLDAAHRAPYGLDRFVQNTWRFGIDRILAGVAMSDDTQGWMGTTLPLDDVDSNKVELAGRLAEFVDGVSGHRRTDRVRPLEQWLDTLTDAVTQLTRRQRTTPGRPLSCSASSLRSWPRRRSTAERRCASTMFGRCWPANWPAGPPGRTSAPGR